jgi:ribosome biogenesis GTPase / thiamine phosphate phosphatase
MTDQPPEQQDTINITDTRQGLVIGTAPGLFWVYTDGERVLCGLRGNLRKAGRPARQGARATRLPAPVVEEPAAPTRVAVGDQVRFVMGSPGEGVIQEILPRTSALRRARAEGTTEQIMLANLTLAVLVFAVQQPEPHFGMLDRYLAICENSGIPAAICFNKCDLGVPDEVSAAADYYGRLGYPIVWTSAKTQDGLDTVRALLHGEVSLFTGPSGVGKSSLTNDLIPDANQRTGEISLATGKGTHTTTGLRLLSLPDGGWLADSAGLRSLDLWDVAPDDLVRCFRELAPLADACEYEGCTHTEEQEGCALRQALADCVISLPRFTSFLRMLDEAHARHTPTWARR